MESENTLRIFSAPSGQWSGALIDEHGVEIGGIAGCSSEQEVEIEAELAGMEFDSVEVVFED
jgi:hypothetical protein